MPAGNVRQGPVLSSPAEAGLIHYFPISQTDLVILIISVLFRQDYLTGRSVLWSALFSDFPVGGFIFICSIDAVFFRPADKILVLDFLEACIFDFELKIPGF